MMDRLAGGSVGVDPVFHGREGGGATLKLDMAGAHTQGIMGWWADGLDWAKRERKAAGERGESSDASGCAGRRGGRLRLLGPWDRAFD
jgi:hypothetical protein